MDTETGDRAHAACANDPERAHAIDEDWRPRTRGDCDRVPRPCPYVACRHHLYLDVHSPRRIRPMFPGLEPEELPESCSLDLAERGGMTLGEVGELLGGVSRERIRQIQTVACRKLRLPLYRVAPSDYEDSAHVDEPELGELSYYDMESAIVVGSFEP